MEQGAAVRRLDPDLGESPTLMSAAPTPFDLFPRAKPVIAVLHVGPSPGLPGAVCMRSLVDRTVTEARVLLDLGVDGLLIENSLDAPASSEAEPGPEVVATLTRVAVAVRRNVNRLPVGVRLLHADRASLAVAHAAGCQFVRVDGWDRDPTTAARFHRYRAAIGAERLPVFADVRPRDVTEAAALACSVAAARADVAVVLGPTAGESPNVSAVEAAREATDLPLFSGGGLGPENLADYLDASDGFVVGCGLKEQRQHRAPLCEPRVRSLVGALEYARGEEVRQ